MKKFASLVVVYSILLSFALPVRSQTQETFRLRDAGAAPKETAKPQIEIKNLGDAETNAVLARLPEMPAAKVTSPAESILNAPKRPKPPEFPSTPAIPDVPVGSKLEVLRATPSGSVAFAGDLSVTFNQPMIGIASPERASEQVPVKLSPSIPGRWRWLGTKTLIFDADKRFPMATEFTATIPAGTKSQSGAELKEEYSWKFQTAVPLVESAKVAAEDSSRPDAVVAVRFNQRIDPSAVLAKMSATADGNPVALRLASGAEIAADKTIAGLVKDYPESRWLAVRAADGFPLASKIVVTNEAGTPSAEGPLTMPVKSTFLFNTYAPLAVKGSGCGGNCYDFNDLDVEFNNPLDEASVDEKSVTVEPKIDNMKVSADGKSISISGAKESRKKYRVTVSPKVRDVFGQTLGRASSIVVETVAREPELRSELAYRRLVTLDPASKKQISVSSVNIDKLRVRLRRVTPDDYAAFAKYRDNDEPGNSVKIGTLFSDRVVKVRSKPDEYETTTIDLTPALTGGVGHVIVECFPEGKQTDDRILVWIQSTRLGVDALTDAGATHIYASELANGKPLGGVEIGFVGGETAKTSANGIGILKTPTAEMPVLVARLGVDSVLIPEETYGREWVPDDSGSGLRWFVFDDRGLYRPGETVSIKGYVRRASAGPTTDIEDSIPDATEIAYTLVDPRAVEAVKGTVKMNSFGAFDFKVTIPDGINLGTQNLRFTQIGRDDSSVSHRFDVREFRRPEFEVSSTVETLGPIIAGGTGIVAAEAKYFSGGGLKDAETNWNVRAVTADYAPPGHEDFNFGIYRHWWESRFGYIERDTKVTTFEAKTDATGVHRLAIDTAPDDSGLPRVFSTEARVADVNRQSFSASTSFLVHPADRYIGLRTARTFVTEGDKTTVEAIVTDIDGAVKAGANFEIVAELKSWRRVEGSWRNETIDTQRCSLVSTTDVLACDFTARMSGDFEFTATVTDAAGRKSVSRLDVTVAGGGFSTRSYGELEQEKAELIPDKRTYAPGETAEILVNAPFFPAEGVMTLRRNGVVRTERFTMDRAFTVLKVQVEEGFVPNLHVKVDLFGKTKRVLFDDENDDKLPARPAFAGGEVELDVKLDSRRLRVSAEPRSKELLPGGETAVDVAVAGPDGKPLANSEVALVAVDESVLALGGMKIDDPLNAIYKNLESGVEDRYSRSNVMLADFFDLDIDLKALGLDNIGFGSGYGSGSGSGNGMGSGDGGANENVKAIYRTWLKKDVAYIMTAPSAPDAIRVRRNFDALALFSPSVVTDANGRATVAIKLPDSLTRYRITAVATNGAKLFGSTESNLTATQPLSVRPSAPRFLNLGDTAEIPVVVKNDGKIPQTIDVAIRASNINFKAGNGRRVTVPAGDRAEIRFPVTTSATGTARFQVAAVSGGASDAAEFSFPVLTPATSVSFATYGTVADNGVFGENVEIPSDIYRDFGGVEVTASSTRLQDLTDAFLYLQSYPYDCSEQVSSRILSVAALGPLLTEFKSASMPKRDEIDARMNDDIAILEKRQHSDGGFNYWTQDGASLPFLSIHVTHALVRAAARGYRIPPKMLEKALGYVGKIDANLALASYNDDSRIATLAFAAYVRALADDEGAAREARRIVAKNDPENLTPETLGWLYAALEDDKDAVETREKLRGAMLNRVTETADSASFATGYTDGDYTILTSNRRQDAVVLDALLREPGAARDELLPKIAHGLLAGRKRGYWTNTQENAFVLTALGSYFQTLEEFFPDFRTRAWLGEKFIGEAALKGRETMSRSFGAPFAAFPASAATLPFVIEKQGAGRLYYRVGLTFARRAESIKATDNGFEVIRTISAADDPSDMRPHIDGGYVVRAGARLKVKLTLVATSPRYHVALVDHLAAGFETIDESLGGSEKLANKREFVYRWYEHKNLRDDRVEIFQSYLRPGVYEYEYFVRATSPGTFIVPPAKAEEMYAPETFGRTASERIIVE